MFKTSLEKDLKRKLENLKEEIIDLKQKIWFIEKEKNYLEREFNLKTEERLNELKKEMQKDLIESDLKRIESVSKLETYKEMDTKDERAEIIDMLKAAIKGLSNSTVNVVK